MSSGSCFAMYRIVTAEKKFSLQAIKVTWLTHQLIVCRKYEQIYVCLIYNAVFTQNFLSKTCLRAVRENWLIRRHADQQAGVFHSTASVVNSRRSVCKGVGGRSFRTTCCPNTWSLLWTERDWRFPLTHTHIHAYRFHCRQNISSGVFTRERHECTTRWFYQ